MTSLVLHLSIAQQHRIVRSKTTVLSVSLQKPSVQSKKTCDSRRLTFAEADHLM
jgi:hypothetical protein